MRLSRSERQALFGTVAQSSATPGLPWPAAIRALHNEALAAGDEAQATLCTLALDGDRDARTRVPRRDSRRQGQPVGGSAGGPLGGPPAVPPTNTTTPGEDPSRKSIP